MQNISVGIFPTISVWIRYPKPTSFYLQSQ
jgi:hypothetical protein